MLYAIAMGQMINGHTQIRMAQQPMWQERNVYVLITTTVCYSKQLNNELDNNLPSHNSQEHAQTHIKPAGFEPT